MTIFPFPQRKLHRILSVPVQLSALLGFVLAAPSADAKPIATDILELQQQFKAHDLQGESLIQVAYSPSSDRFITAASDGVLKIWDRPAVLQRQFIPNPAPMLFNARMEPDQTTLITAAYNGFATRWSVNQLQPVQRYGPHLSGVTDVEILPTNAGVVTISDDGSIRFWGTDGKLRHRIQRPGVSRHLALARQRGLIAVSQDIGAISLLNNRAEVLQIMATQQGRLNDVIFSPDEQVLLTAGFDGSVKFWDVSDPARPWPLLRTIPAVDGSGWVEGLAMNREGLLASVSDDGVLRLWSADGQLLRAIKLSDHHLMSVSFSPDGRRLLAAAQDGTVSVLRLAQPR